MNYIKSDSKAQQFFISQIAQRSKSHLDQMRLYAKQALISATHSADLKGAAEAISQMNMSAKGRFFAPPHH